MSSLASSAAFITEEGESLVRKSIPMQKASSQPASTRSSVPSPHPGEKRKEAKTRNAIESAPLRILMMNLTASRTCQIEITFLEAETRIHFYSDESTTLNTYGNKRLGILIHMDFPVCYHLANRLLVFRGCVFLISVFALDGS